ncbi:hypothetical protein C5S29_12705 [ANME-1 cluster archaeon GoMg3.2]|nr:hypothetical protein [ANME-1 cluster archaeon GoMg3.2]
MTKKKVLIITYSFPPVGGGTFLRTLKYVKYLPTYGWNSIVLTARYNQSEGDVCDLSLMDEIPKGTEIFRERSPSLVDTFYFLKKKRDNTSSKEYNFLNQKDSVVKRLLKLLYHFITKFSVPDIYILWVPFAIIKAMKIIKNSDVNLIYSTTPPHSTHLVGYVVKRISRKPGVVDFRDGWTENPLFKSSNKIRARIERYMERKVLASADKIICATGPIADELKGVHPFIESSKFTVISNGFDPNDVMGIDHIKPQKFTITYTGGFWKYKTPYYFIKAIKQLIDENEKIKHDIQVFFVGGFLEDSKHLIEELSLMEQIHIVGYVSHNESIKYQLQSNVLLLMLYEEEDGTAVAPGKMFEYIGAKKPILALVPEGHVANLIRSENLGKVVPPRDITAIKDAIYEMYLKHKEDNLELKMDETLFKKYDRKELTRQLAEVFDEVSK